MRKSILIFILLILPFIGNSQSKTVDSLETVLEQTGGSDKKVVLYNALYLETKDQSDSSVTYLDKAERLVNSVHDTIKIAWLINKADQKVSIGDYPSSFTYLDRALVLTSKEEPESIIDIHILKGLANYNKGDYGNAIQSYMSALKISDSLLLKNKTARIYNNIGIGYIKLENWTKAEFYMKESLAICEELNLKFGMTFTLGNLGIIYRNQNNLDEALLMYQKSIAISESMNNKRATGRTLISVGKLYEEKQEYQKALTTYERSLEIMTEFSEKQSLSIIYLNLGSLKTKMKDFEEARSYYNKGLLITEDAGMLDNTKNIREGLSQLHDIQGDYKSALRERQKIDILKDSIISKNHLEAISKLDIQYQSEKKDKEILAQTLALEKSKSKTQIMTILIITLLLASILLWFLFQQRQKRIEQQLVTIQKEQEVLTLESLIAGEEKERLRIAQELHDGVNGDLAAIKYKLSSLLKMNNEVINEAVTMIDNSCQQVRAISHNLVPPSLKDFNLPEAIQNYCENLQDANNPEITFQLVGNPIEVDKKSEINMFRIVQELVSNAIKHAKASTIDVQVSYQESLIQLSVEDNGKGIEITPDQAKGIGLDNIKSRVEYLHAEMDTLSNAQGTSHTIAIHIKGLNDN